MLTGLFGKNFKLCTSLYIIWIFNDTLSRPVSHSNSTIDSSSLFPCAWVLMDEENSHLSALKWRSLTRHAGVKQQPTHVKRSPCMLINTRALTLIANADARRTNKGNYCRQERKKSRKMACHLIFFFFFKSCFDAIEKHHNVCKSKPSRK